MLRVEYYTTFQTLNYIKIFLFPVDGPTPPSGGDGGGGDDDGDGGDGDDDEEEEEGDDDYEEEEADDDGDEESEMVVLDPDHVSSSNLHFNLVSAFALITWLV